MKTEVRLNSTTAFGVSGPKAGMINLIYRYLLAEFKEDFYSFIGINQTDLNEVVVTSGKRVNVNVHFVTDSTFETKNDHEQNLIRLEVVHNGLSRIAEKYKKISVMSLNDIKELVIAKNFYFEIICKTVINKKKPNLKANILVVPQPTKFSYFVDIENENRLVCRIPLYEGITNTYYFAGLFSKGKWDGIDKLILSGIEKQVDCVVSLNDCKINYINLTSFEKPPFFEMMKAGITEDEKSEAHKNWIKSLPLDMGLFDNTN